MAPWVPRKSRRNESVIYLIVDFRHYRKDVRFCRKFDAEIFGDKNLYANSLLPQKKVLMMIRARVVAGSCFPNKLKKYESQPSWRRKDKNDGKHNRQHRRFASPSSTSGRPTVLLPPMQWTATVQDPSPASNTAPVVSSRVQDYSSSLSSPSIVLQATPSAPSPGEVFYNSEDQADIEFIVGAEEWRFPAHSFILDRRSSTLRALLETADDDGKKNTATGQLTVLKLPGLQPDIFEQMLRYLYTHQVTLSSVKSALNLLQTSQTYHIPELAIQCLAYISAHLTPSKVLIVLSYLLQPCIDGNSADGSECHNQDNLQNELIFRCFQVVDCNADAILLSEDFENLEHELLVEILKRDTLGVSSEAIVFEAAMRWACRTCKKQRKELTADNKSMVLGKVLFLVRYLLMTQEEFLRGPVSQGVLSKEDKEVLMSRIGSNKTPLPLPEHWMGWNISTKRHNRNLLSVTSPGSTGTNTSISPTSSVNKVKSGTERKKKSMSKKFLNGVGDLVICVIHMLD